MSGDRNLRLYLIGLVGSMFGDSAMSVVSGIWVKQLTGSNRDAALVSVGIFAPSLLAPLTGLLADRFPRRPFLIAVNLLAAAAMSTLLLVRGAGQTWLIFVVITYYGLTLVLIDPAETALFSELLAPDERGPVNGLRLTLQEGCKLIAPLAGAGLFALSGGGVVAVLDAVTFAGAAGCLLLMRLPHRDQEAADPEHQHWRTELLAGLRHVRATRPLARLVLTGAGAMLVSGVAFAARFSLLDGLHRPPAFLGVLTAVLGAGSIVGGLASRTLIVRVGEARLAWFGLGNSFLGYLLLATGWLPTVLIGNLIQGCALPWVVIAVVTAGQRLTPPDLQGRVAAVITTGLFATQPVAQAVGAGLVDVVSYRFLYLGAGLANALIAVAVRTSRRARSSR